MFRSWLLRLADRQQTPVFADDLSTDAAVVNGEVGGVAGAREGAVMVEKVP